MCEHCQAELPVWSRRSIMAGAGFAACCQRSAFRFGTGRSAAIIGTGAERDPAGRGARPADARQCPLRCQRAR